MRVERMRLTQAYDEGRSQLWGHPDEQGVWKEDYAECYRLGYEENLAVEWPESKTVVFDPDDYDLSDDTDDEDDDALTALKAERDALAAELAKAREPVWFYHPDYTETCQFGLWDVIEYYDLEPGKHVVEVETARPLPSIWCVVHVLTDKEKDALETDEAWFCTEHATEAEARAALQQKDRNDDQ